MLHSPAKRTRAKLVKIPGLEWETNFVDEERRKWQEAKMQTKVTRAETQLSALGLDRGSVVHLLHPGQTVDELYSLKQMQRNKFLKKPRSEGAT